MGNEMLWNEFISFLEAACDVLMRFWPANVINRFARTGGRAGNHQKMMIYLFLRRRLLLWVGELE